MAHSEACQLFIEQQIKEGLDEGRTPYSIGKDLAEMVQKLFEAQIPARTIEQKARRIDATNVANSPTAQDDSGIEEKQTNQTVTFQSVDNKHVPGPGRPPKFIVKPEPNRTQFKHENEWYTPIEYIELARRCLCEIDLDPASCDFAQSRVKAKQYFTKIDDGLVQEWRGKVWLNPPYSQPDIQKFAEKLIAEWNSKRVCEAIILTHNYTDTAWFHLLASHATLICFTRGRIRFESRDGDVGSPTQGQAFFYFGNNKHAFVEAFSSIGLVFTRED